MSDVPSHVRMYLVRHGEAKSKEEDPERGLTEAGRADVNRIAVWAAAAGIRAGEVRHSGKLRAQQTAEIVAEHLVVRPAEAIRDEQRDIMLVGHLPFLERLASLLIAGGAETGVVSLDAGALLELTQTENGWTATCLMQPRLLPGS